MKLRDYQERGLERVAAEFRGGATRVLAVAPTGAGKGDMAAWRIGQAARAGKRVVFLVHRREIVRDIAKRLQTKLGVPAGTILPNAPRTADRVQIASVQSLMAREKLPPADLVVVDEAHHYAADEWGALLERYRKARVLGFTATPQRADGRAMGNVFESLVVVATYSELIAAGYIVPCQVMRPPNHLGIDLAQDPLRAYKRYADGTAALVYARRVDDAIALRKRFERAGYAARVVHAGTGDAERKDTIARFADGSVTVVVNVYTLTEGVDVPRASTIVLGRTCQHASTYVQIVGRALRPHRNKRSALLLDLTGVSHKHGLPTDDREYTLDGSGMGEGVAVEREGVEREERVPKVLGVDLKPVGATALQRPEPDVDAKRERWRELAASVEAKRMTVAAAVTEYAGTYGEKPPWLDQLSDEAKAREMRRAQAAHPRLAHICKQEIFG